MNKVAEKLPIEVQPPAAITPMDMLNQAVAKGADMEVLEKLMDLQERWELNQARKAFDYAIAEAKKEIPPIIRNAKGHNDKKYADFSAIASVIDPILGKFGLSYRFRTTQADTKISVSCVLFGHGHSEQTTLTGPADQSGNKNAIQAIGSTLTYLQRYSLMQALGLAAARDDDGKGAAAKPPITQEQADQIRELLEANGKDRTKFLKWARVETIEDIPADHFTPCVEAIQAKK